MQGTCRWILFIYFHVRSQSQCYCNTIDKNSKHLQCSLNFELRLTVSEFVRGRDFVCNFQVCSILTLLAATGVVLVLKVVFNREKILILRGKQSVLTLNRRLIRYFVKIFF